MVRAGVRGGECVGSTLLLCVCLCTWAGAQDCLPAGHTPTQQCGGAEVLTSGWDESHAVGLKGTCSCDHTGSAPPSLGDRFRRTPVSGSASRKHLPVGHWFHGLAAVCWSKGLPGPLSWQLARPRLPPPRPGTGREEDKVSEHKALPLWGAYNPVEQGDCPAKPGVPGVSSRMRILARMPGVLCGHAVSSVGWGTGRRY